MICRLAENLVISSRMKHVTFVANKQKFVVLKAEEYFNLLEDMSDLKKVLARSKQTSIDAQSFFKKLRTNRK
jgi:hypothetical protein